MKEGNLTLARSMTFASIIIFEWFLAVQMRSEEKSLLRVGLFKNKMLNGSSLFAYILLFLILYIPKCQRIFSTQGLSLKEWLICALPGVIILGLEGIRKKWKPNLFSYGKWQRKQK